MTAAFADELTLAPRWRRLVAFAIDVALLSIGYIIAFKIAKILQYPIRLGFVVNLLIFLGYFVGITRSKWGATPGKWLLGLRVVDDEFGRPMSNHRAVGRAFSQLLPMVPFLYYFYVFYPNMLEERYYYRQGTLAMYNKMQSGQELTEDEKRRWDNFQTYVQQPLNDMSRLSLRLTGGAFLVSGIIMCLHRQRKAVHDMLCETRVVMAKS